MSKTYSAPKVSPLAPDRFPSLPAVPGVRFAAASAGVKYAGRLDVMLVHIESGASIAGVFTRSATRAAPVLDCEAKLAALTTDAEGGFAILVNSGNANAFTGAAGDQAVDRLCQDVAQSLAIPAEHIFTASTGVIGEPLPQGRIAAVISQLADDLSESGAEAAAQAILTTDTFPKGAVQKFEIDGETATMVGFAKGSGMIAPDMGTMLGYVFTDAAVAPDVLQEALTKATRQSFNAITVDSDTSTSDTVMLAATGRAGHGRIDDLQSEAGASFQAALNALTRDLALQIVRDGEGASKLVEVEVSGAETDGDADKVARSIANSPLVKTAIAGEDPNWGRIVMAVGKSGARADRDRLAIWFGDHLVAEKGWVAESYREEDGAAYMRASELKIKVDLGLGAGHATVWTCDLTKDYISINADYRS